MTDIECTETVAELIERHRQEAEAAGKRLTAAIDAVVRVGLSVHSRDPIIAELRAAAADAYDTGVDLPMELQQRGVTGTGGQRFAIQVSEGITGAELETIKAALQPGDLVWIEGQPILNVVGGTPPVAEPEPVEHPETPYMVRVYYADDTMEEIPDIVGVQVANVEAGTFPIGFIRTDDEAEPEPGTFDDDGIFVPLKPRKPGW